MKQFIKVERWKAIAGGVVIDLLTEAKNYAITHDCFIETRINGTELSIGSCSDLNRLEHEVIAPDVPFEVWQAANKHADDRFIDKAARYWDWGFCRQDYLVGYRAAMEKGANDKQD